mgnify:CR=1 FL=1
MLSVIQLPSLEDRIEDPEDIGRTIMDNSSNFIFDSRKIELSDEASSFLQAQNWSKNPEHLVQKITNAGSSIEDRIITPEVLQA